MSGVVRSVKKVFKKVGRAVKKVLPVAAVAAAAFFTGGLALSAIPATSAFAASLPGFAGAAGAGTGIFSKAASFLGLGGGLAAGAVKAGTAASALAPIYGTSTVGRVLAATGAAGGAAPAATTAAVGGAAATGASAGAAAGAAAKGIGLAGASFTEKLLFASMGMQALGQFLAPSSRELARDQAIEQAKHRGAFYGMEAGGGGYTADQLPVQRPPTTPASPAPPAQPPGGTAGDLFAASGDRTSRGKFPSYAPSGTRERAIEAPAVTPLEPFPDPMKTNRDLFARVPGVRYV